MKKILLIALLALSASCGSVQYLKSPILPQQKAVMLETSKDVNFVNANEWMVETFNNAESVIQYSDKEAGIVKGKYSIFSASAGRTTYYGYGITNTVGKYDGLTATITVRVKDGEARLEIVPNKTYLTYSVYQGKASGYTNTEYTSKVNTLIVEFENRMNIVTNDY